mmetsp:Transcript_40824/g.117945  ORF Transcript_40824/g.117945 Transcript_40824/m.117945 type:complete len:752 (-) Transcript_40824:1189-3444(-)
MGFEDPLGFLERLQGALVIIAVSLCEADVEQKPYSTAGREASCLLVQGPGLCICFQSTVVVSPGPLHDPDVAQEHGAIHGLQRAHVVADPLRLQQRLQSAGLVPGNPLRGAYGREQRQSCRALQRAHAFVLLPCRVLRGAEGAGGGAAAAAGASRTDAGKQGGPRWHIGAERAGTERQLKAVLQHGRGPVVQGDLAQHPANCIAELRRGLAVELARGQQVPQLPLRLLGEPGVQPPRHAGVHLASPRAGVHKPQHRLRLLSVPILALLHPHRGEHLPGGNEAVATVEEVSSEPLAVRRRAEDVELAAGAQREGHEHLRDAPGVGHVQRLFPGSDDCKDLPNGSHPAGEVLYEGVFLLAVANSAARSARSRALALPSAHAEAAVPDVGALWGEAGLAAVPLQRIGQVSHARALAAAQEVRSSADVVLPMQHFQVGHAHPAVPRAPGVRAQRSQHAALHLVEGRASVQAGCVDLVEEDGAEVVHADAAGRWVRVQAPRAEAAAARQRGGPGAAAALWQRGAGQLLLRTRRARPRAPRGGRKRTLRARGARPLLPSAATGRLHGEVGHGGRGGVPPGGEGLGVLPCRALALQLPCAEALPALAGSQAVQLACAKALPALAGAQALRFARAVALPALTVAEAFQLARAEALPALIRAQGVLLDLAGKLHLHLAALLRQLLGELRHLDGGLGLGGEGVLHGRKLTAKLAVPHLARPELLLALLPGQAQRPLALRALRVQLLLEIGEPSVLGPALLL